MKKTVTMTIEENLWKRAKKQVPNISEFVEECLKQYMGLYDGTVPTADTKEILDEIGRLQTKLFILNENIDIEEDLKLVEAEKINRPFRALWNDYRRRLEMNPELMHDVLEVVDVDEETLEDILDFAYENMDSFSLNFSWEEVYSRYQQEEMKE